MKKVIIWGYTGYIGNFLCKALDFKNIYYIGINSSNYAEFITKSENLDLIGNSVNVFLAIKKFAKDKFDFKNYVNNLSLLEYFVTLKKNNKIYKNFKFIYASSDAVYPYSTSVEDYIDEEIKPNPDNLYGLMHLHREQLLSTLISAEQLLILRISQIYGPHHNENNYGPVKMLFDAINFKKIDLYGNGEEIRNHIYINDVVNCIYQNILNFKSGLLNVATKKSISFMEITNNIIQLLSKNIKINKMPRISNNKINYKCINNNKFEEILNTTSFSDGIKQVYMINLDNRVHNTNE